MSAATTGMVLALLLMGVTCSAAEVVDNPFAGFETYILPNGLRVWYRRLPGAANVSVSAVVPVGMDHDPPGKEQLAHFVEHMLFSDHAGRTEEQIKREIEARGGTYNGMTWWDRTDYFVNIGRAHGLFALRWLARVLAPHTMDPAVVERQREPIAIEVEAKQREILDWVEAYFIDPPWFRVPQFWEREFGMRTYAARDYYPYRSLQTITAGDLRKFYEKYYVPAWMTVAVIGDLPRDRVIATVREVFGRLPKRPLPKDEQSLRDPDRPFRMFTYDFQANTDFDLTYKFYRPDRRTYLMLLFLSQWLDKRLNDLLRHGPIKATYGISSYVLRRGKVAVLSVTGELKREETEFARRVIRRELDVLRAGTLPPTVFERERQILVQQLKVQNQTPEDLASWVRRHFYDTRLFPDFPDVVAFFQSVQLDEVRNFVRKNLVPQHEVLYQERPLPVRQEIVIFLALFLPLLVLQIARRVLIQPIRMDQIRYLARIQLPRFRRYILRPLVFFVVLYGLRFLIYIYQWICERWLFQFESFTFQATVGSLMYASLFGYGIIFLARVPHKILVFPDHLRIKYRAYRSKILPHRAGIEMGRYRLFEALRRGPWWRCRFLTGGLWQPGIYLRYRDGSAWFFRVRNPDEFMRCLQGLWEQSSHETHPDALAREGNRYATPRSSSS